MPVLAILPEVKKHFSSPIDEDGGGHNPPVDTDEEENYHGDAAQWEEGVQHKGAHEGYLRKKNVLGHWLTLTKIPNGSVADPDPVGSEPFWSDPDPINCPDLTIKRNQTEKKSNKLNRYVKLFDKKKNIPVTNKWWIRNKKLSIKQNNLN